VASNLVIFLRINRPQLCVKSTAKFGGLATIRGPMPPPQRGTATVLILTVALVAQFRIFLVFHCILEAPGGLSWNMLVPSLGGDVAPLNPPIERSQFLTVAVVAQLRWVGFRHA